MQHANASYPPSYPHAMPLEALLLRVAQKIDFVSMELDIRPEELFKAAIAAIPKDDGTA